MGIANSKNRMNYFSNKNDKNTIHKIVVITQTKKIGINIRI